MANLYVPIDYSNVSEIVPEGDDILYSTLCKYIKAVVGGTVKVKVHAVVTQSGIAFCALKRKKKKIYIEFIEWDQLTEVKSFMGKTVLKWGWSNYKRIRIDVLRDPELESKESFLGRKNKFMMICKEAWSKKVSQD